MLDICEQRDDSCLKDVFAQQLGQFHREMGKQGTSIAEHGLLLIRKLLANCYLLDELWEAGVEGDLHDLAFRNIGHVFDLPQTSSDNAHRLCLQRGRGLCYCRLYLHQRTPTG